MAVETKYTYQNHHHKHQFVGGEELPAREAASQVKVSQVINIKYYYTIRVINFVGSNCWQVIGPTFQGFGLPQLHDILLSS